MPSASGPTGDKLANGLASRSRPQRRKAMPNEAAANVPASVENSSPRVTQNSLAVADNSRNRVSELHNGSENRQIRSTKRRKLNSDVNGVGEIAEEDVTRQALQNNASHTPGKKQSRRRGAANQEPFADFTSEYRPISLVRENRQGRRGPQAKTQSNADGSRGASSAWQRIANDPESLGATRGSIVETPDSSMDRQQTRDTSDKAARKQPRRCSRSAELDLELDPETITMGSLLDKKRAGKKSELDTALNNVDWAEIKAKKEELRAAEIEKALAGKPIHSHRQEDEMIDEPDGSEDAHYDGPTLKLVNGELVVDSSAASGAGGRSNDPSRPPAAYLDTLNPGGAIVDEQEETDLTTKTTKHSFLHTTRRDPLERAVAGRATQWSGEQTIKFYDALRMFGTDFQMIAAMFPGRTRRQIKQKFISEERTDKVAVDSALLNERIPMDLKHFAEHAHVDMKSFKDPRVVTTELREAEERQRRELEAEDAAARERAAKKQEEAREKARAKEARKREKGNRKSRSNRKKADLLAAAEANGELVSIEVGANDGNIEAVA